MRHIAVQTSARGADLTLAADLAFTNAKSRGGPRLLGSLKFGAGEGIRTLDPDLGKVVLYP